MVENVNYDVRIVMTRIANCIKILESSLQPIYETTIIHAYSASAEFEVQELIKIEVMDEVASEVRNRIAETGE
uniref:Uncharacterized protein n=1 Tax=Panagrolaimus sp. JU765 TaxID=591449 RepID=A0AC34QSY8_9BILA